MKILSSVSIHTTGLSLTVNGNTGSAEQNGQNTSNLSLLRTLNSL